MIRVTGGLLRGRALPGPVPDGVRPTSARVREALFSMVGQDLSGLSFLDLFGGSGLMAIEALSRGASPVHIVEQDARAAALIRDRLRALGLLPHGPLPHGPLPHGPLPHAPTAARVLTADALRLPPDLTADLVFADPPYRLAPDPASGWLPAAAARARRALAAEARCGAAWPDRVGALSLDRVRAYGDTELAIYRADTEIGTPEADTPEADTPETGSPPG